MQLKRKLVGKYRAARTLGQFMRYLEDWAEVWQAYRRGRPLPCPLRLRNGLALEFAPRDNVVQLFQEIIVHQAYVPPWFYRPRPGDVVLDVGANLGFFATWLAANFPGLQVHCFEPAPATRALLERNLQTNRLGDTVRVHPFAVAGHTGSACLKWSADSIHRSFFANEDVDDARSESVATLSLAEAVERCAAPRIALLKVDAEGSEVEILANAPGSILARITRVVLEYHDHFRPGARQVAETVLRARGFHDIRLGHLTRAGMNGILYALR